MVTFGWNLSKIWRFSKKRVSIGGYPQIILKTVRVRSFDQNKLCKYFLVTKILKNSTVPVIVIKFDRKLLHINTMNRTENRHSQPKIGQFTAIFVLGKMPKIEPIKIFLPSFRQKFSIIILSNLFKIERFRIKNGWNMTFF